VVGDPRDAWTYRIAVGALGLALLVVLVGVIVLAAVDGPDPSVASFSKSHTTTTFALLKPRTVSGSQSALTIPVLPADSTVAVAPEISVDPAKSSTPAGSAAIPSGLYVLAATLLAGLLGVLVPLPRLPPLLSKRRSGLSPERRVDRTDEWWSVAVRVALAVALVAIAYAVLSRWVTDEYVALVGAAALLGLLAPSPAKRW
jgi:hypothetical protein